MARSEGTRRLEAVLAELDPPRKGVARALRDVIRSEGPGLSEDVKWNAPTWAGNGRVFCLMVYDHAVHLGLFRGAELSKKYSVIEGTGKSLRHVKVPTAEAARSTEVRAVVRDALALDQATAAKPSKR